MTNECHQSLSQNTNSSHHHHSMNKLMELSNHKEIQHKFQASHCDNDLHCQTSNCLNTNIESTYAFNDQNISTSPRLIRDQKDSTKDNVGPFECPYESCTKIFKYKCSVVQHLKIHYCEKNYNCKFCGKKFLTKGNWKKHEQSHLKKKIYQCNECGMRFFR